MIHKKIPMLHIDSTVIHPMSLKIAHDLKKILFIDETIKTKLEDQLNSFIANTSNKSHDRAMNRMTEEMILTVTDKASDEMLLLSELHKYEYPNIISDEKVGCKVSPMYNASDLVFSISYSSIYKSKVENVQNIFRQIFARNETAMLHDVEYTIDINKDIMDLFLNIYRLRNKDIIKDTDFIDYINKITKNKLNIVTDSTGKNYTFAVKEKQLGVLGIFTTTIDDLQQTKSEKGYELSIDYSVSYKKPVWFDVIYHMVVYNGALPMEYYAPQISDRLKITDSDTSTSNKYLDHFRDHTPLDQPVINIPYFDTFIPGKTSQYLPIFTLLVTIDKENPLKLINLRDLGEISLTNYMLSLIENYEYPHITSPNESIFNIYLNIDDNGSRNMNAFDILYIDKDLNVMLKESIVSDFRYRIVFTMSDDLNHISNSARDRAIKYTELFNNYTKIYDEINNSGHPSNSIQLANIGRSAMVQTVMTTRLVTDTPIRR